jgi:predicted house-cleaning noncanonical NTP pyrophosphatase (MazG superfamily)
MNFNLNYKITQKELLELAQISNYLMKLHTKSLLQEIKGFNEKENERQINDLQRVIRNIMEQSNE